MRDYKLLFKISTPIVLKGALMIFIYVVLTLLAVAFDWANQLVLLYTYLMLIGFALLYLLESVNIYKKYKLDPVACGTVTCFCHIVCSLITLFLYNMIAVLTFAGVKNLALRTSEFVVIGNVLDPAFLATPTGLIISDLCWVGLTGFGGLINFILGAIGGMYGFKKFSK